MRLLRSADVDMNPNDRVYSHSRALALIPVLVVLGVVGWVISHAFTAGWKPGYYIAAAILLFFDLLRGYITARFRPSNWLVRANDQGMFIQFRSYLNYHLPADDLTVVFISYQEIRSALLVREKVTVPDPANNASTTEYLRYVELELAGDLAPLANALEAEEVEKAPTEKRWYGNSSTLYQGYPVRMSSPPFLRLRWDVIPGAKKFLQALRPYTAIADPVSLKQDFTRLEGLSREEQEHRLREMVSRGESIAATYTAQKLYGCGLGDAKTIVDGLVGPTTAAKPKSELLDRN